MLVVTRRVCRSARHSDEFLWGKLALAGLKLELGTGHLHLRSSGSMTRQVHLGSTNKRERSSIAQLLFSWGDNEGKHFTGTIDNPLVGASTPPPLF